MMPMKRRHWIGLVAAVPAVIAAAWAALRPGPARQILKEPTPCRVRRVADQVGEVSNRPRVAVSRDGTLIATAVATYPREVPDGSPLELRPVGTVFVDEVDSGARRASIVFGPIDPYFFEDGPLALSPDARLVAIANWVPPEKDRASDEIGLAYVPVWDIATGATVATLKFNPSAANPHGTGGPVTIEISTVSVSRIEATAGVPGPPEVARSASRPKEVEVDHLGFSADAATLYVAHESGPGDGIRIERWSTKGWAPVSGSTIPTGFAKVAIAPGGLLLAEVGWDGEDREIRIRDTATGRVVATCDRGASSRPEADLIESLAFSPDGRTLALAAGPAVEVYGIGPKTRRSTGPVLGPSIDRTRRPMGFSADGRWLAVAGTHGPRAGSAPGGTEGRVFVVDVESGRVARSFDTPGQDVVASIHFAAGGRTIVTEGCAVRERFGDSPSLAAATQIFWDWGNA